MGSQRGERDKCEGYTRPTDPTRKWRTQRRVLNGRERNEDRGLHNKKDKGGQNAKGRESGIQRKGNKEGTDEVRERGERRGKTKKKEGKR